MTHQRATRHHPDDPANAQVLALIRASFAGMEGRIDPPSSMLQLTLASVAEQCRTGEVWSLGDPAVACMFLTPKPGCLSLGKLATAESHRGAGLARRLVGIGAERARALGFGRLELQARVELVENHAAFARMGFVKTGETAHPGYARATSITMAMLLD